MTQINQIVHLLESILTVVGIGYAAFGVYGFISKRKDPGRGQSDGSDLWTIVLGVALAILGGAGFISGLVGQITLGS